MNTKMIKKIASVGLAAMMSGCLLADPQTLNLIAENSALVAEAATASGTCGTNLKWSLSGTTLTITGTGSTMNSYLNGTRAPWYTYKSTVKTVILPTTLKKIGAYAFYGMSAMEYVYANGTPCLPNLTDIGEYAFYGCTALRGNTQSGSLTFGINPQDSVTLTIGKNAFYNCKQIRILKSNYRQMTVKANGLQNMTALKTVDFSNTSTTLESHAFYHDTSLSNVNIKPSVSSIHNSAFTGTPYKTNGCTNTACYGQNYGNAKKMTGKQLIVNFFVDMTKVNTDYSHGVRSGSASYIFPLRENEIAAKAKNNYYGYKQYYALDKNNITYEHIFSWDAKKSSTQNNNTVVSLNKVDYTSLADQTNISKSIVDNSESSGFFGSNVTSAAIQQRLTQVRNAASDLETQSKTYSSSSLKFEMHPETNFYLTYDSFGWSKNTETINGQTYEVMDGYYGLEHNYLYDGVELYGSSKNPVFASLKKASQRHTGGVTQTIDLCTSSGSTLASYTNYLKQHYGVDGVVYLFHYKAEGQSFAVQNQEISHYQPQHRGTDEFVVAMNATSTAKQKLLIEHEICHLYGAQDYYSAGNLTQNEAQYCQNNFSKDVMICDYNSNSTLVSPATAYSIGWLDRLDNTIFNNVFYSRKKN